MPQETTHDLSRIHAEIITCSDRVLAATKPDTVGPACARALIDAGVGSANTRVAPEERGALDNAVRAALEDGARLVLILGASGFGRGNYAPEVVRDVIEVEIPGIAEQIRAHGLSNTPLSGLSREVVGVTARDSSGALVLSSPGSSSGAQDTLDVLIPLLGAVFNQLDEAR